MLAKIRRMHFRDHQPLREIARQTGLARNTIRNWLRKRDVVEPQYKPRETRSVVDPWAEQLGQWLKTDAHRPKRDRRTARAMFEAIRAQGYAGSYNRVCAFIKRWRTEESSKPGPAYVPLTFALGEAFQFDWSTEYAFIGGLRRKLDVAHTKLCASRAFWLTAYPTQSHEMLFDAHTRAFAAFGGVPRRGIYDNMKTAVDKVGRGKERDINPRFFAMCGHYLFEPEFCNRAAGWEKGRVEKNVQDRRRQIWQHASERRWKDFDELNAWLGEQCRQAWANMANPEWPALTIGELLQDELMQMLPNPKPFDGYVEKPVRVTSTALIHFQRNRYSVPAEHAHAVLSLRIYPTELRLVADGREIARHARSFERDQTFYDFTHYIGIVDRKPGALRNGAPFAEMPEPLLRLQRHLLKQTGGDRVMADVLGAIPHHGLDAVLVAVELALESGRPSGEHVLNVLARLKSGMPPTTPVATTLAVREEPKSDVHRYDRLRAEARHVD
ncbi:IS21 family transposase [uncultured bacterium pMCBF6]|jgi:transposase|uniref:Putative transposase n=2 Tax=root TaxID=1 RepID=F2Q6C3_9BACT|nr:putative transposase [Plasmid pMCBF1]ABO36614.1 putative transposase [uncultured bacterium pMCBF6]|tara:strand:+ start:123 stop:1616 length:1494 start_codon:yes stop_codon:yes gene_type:complete